VTATAAAKMGEKKNIEVKKQESNPTRAVPSSKRREKQSIGEKAAVEEATAQ